MKEGRQFINDAMLQVENPTHIPVKCTAGKELNCLCNYYRKIVKFFRNTNVYSNVCPVSPEFLLLRAEPVLSALENLNTSQTEYSQNQTGTGQ